MKKIIIGLLTLVSFSAFADSYRCTLEAETGCMEKARREVSGLGGISIVLESQTKNAKGGFDNEYTCNVSDNNRTTGKQNNLVYIIKTTADLSGWCKVEKIYTYNFYI